jgi:hypothetical protein
MGTWSVALFGHYKPQYYVRAYKNGKGIDDLGYHVQEPTEDEMAQYRKFIKWDGRYDLEKGVWVDKVDNTKRALPGHIIAVKPYGEGWSENEQQRFLIVTMNDLELSRAEALCEQEQDLNSYETYAPLDADTWWYQQYTRIRAKYANVEKGLRLLQENRSKWYDEYLAATQEACGFPSAHWRKRRFRVEIDVLKDYGVNIEAMLNTQIKYVPKIAPIEIVDVYDKLRERNVRKGDGLNHQRPRTLAEMRNPAPADQIIKGLRT